MTTGVITGRAITVTASTDTKTYDATTSSAAIPTITAGTLAGGDTAAFTQTFDNANVGTAKTLTPAGVVNDGNGGANYTVTFATNSTGEIAARPITVTASSDIKGYDATTSSAAIPTITAGTLAGTDTGSFTQTFDTANVGTAKTLTAAGSVTDGNGGANYAITFATDSTGEITARAITVTAVSDTKAFDGTTTSAGIPTVTSGTLAGTDTGAFSQTFDTADTGSGKTLTPAGSVLDGNAGANYTITFVTDTTGVITGRAITVTATSDTKVYDATTASAAIPTITSGALADGDTAAFTQTFDNANVGTAKTLTPAGTVIDGNGGANYTITFVNDTSGVISARAVTVTASSDTKVYDSTTSSAAIPTITAGTLAGTDTGSFTQAFDTANVGVAKTLTPAGLVSDGNGGANYAITFVNDTSGVISARAITVSATSDTKVYDATTSSAAIPTITSGSLVGADTGSFTQSFDTVNVGTDKTLTPAGLVSDGNGGANYAITFANDTTGVISARAVTVTATTDTKTYDATTSSAAMPTITSGTLVGTDTGSFTQTFDTANVGTDKTLTPTGTISDGNGGANYTITFANDITGVISQWAVTVTADSGQAKIYGTPDPTLTYTVTSGSLQPGDSFSGPLSRSAGENVGITAITQGTLTAGPNYTLTFVPADFTIVARAITVTAASDAKVYDATTASAGVPTVTTGSLAGTDTGSFTQTFDTVNVGPPRR